LEIKTDDILYQRGFFASSHFQLSILGQLAPTIVRRTGQATLGVVCTKENAVPRELGNLYRPTKHAASTKVTETLHLPPRYSEVAAAIGNLYLLR
jgi:hypothetical protein